MARFASFDGTELFYDIEGKGAPVLLLHGFASSATANWRAPGVVGALVEAARQVISLDARGHGRSAKPHGPSAYADDAMIRDAQALLDHLGIERVERGDARRHFGHSSKISDARQGKLSTRMLIRCSLMLKGSRDLTLALRAGRLDY